MASLNCLFSPFLPLVRTNGGVLKGKVDVELESAKQHVRAEAQARETDPNLSDGRQPDPSPEQDELFERRVSMLA